MTATSVALGAAVAAAVVFGVLWWREAGDHSMGDIRIVVQQDGTSGALLQGERGATMHVVVAQAPLVQTGEIAPSGEHAGTVYFPIPYATAPNLTLRSARRTVVATEQGERGFEWKMRPLAEDIDASNGADGGLVAESVEFLMQMKKLKPGIVYDGFTWTASGLRADPAEQRARPFEQSGKFKTISKQEGVVYFALPYATPPNVELSGHAGRSTKVSACNAQSFTWTNVGPPGFHDEGDVTWIAQGVLPQPPK